MATDRSRLKLLAVLLGLALTLSACAPGNSEEPKVEPEQVLSIGATLEPVGLDPTTSSGAGTPFVLLYNVYETLIKIDSNGDMKPLLAKEWSVSDDQTEYTFQLDPAAKFASGKPVNAEAVASSIMRLASGKGTSQMTEQMSVVDVAQAQDEHTVVVKLKRPSNFWLYDMTQTAGIIFDPEGIDELDTKPAGSGPYVFEAHNQGESVILKKNPNYWGTPARFDEVRFRYYADPNAMNSAMASGQLDMISNLVVPSGLSQFADTDKFKVYEGYTPGEVILGFNHASQPLGDLAVRQAIIHAIDRKALLDTVWDGHGKLIGSMVPPSDPWFDESLYGHYSYDPAKAKELLAQSGHTDLKLRLRVPADLIYAVKAAQFIESQLKEVGIQVQIDELEFGTWLEQVYTNADYDMTIVAHIEPRDMTRFADPKYYWRYDNAEFQRLVKEADEGPESESVDKMRAAAAILAEDAAANFLWLLPQIVITTPEISGVAKDQTSLSFDLTTLASSEG